MRLLYLFLFSLLSILLGAAPALANDSHNVSLLGRWAEGPCLALEATGGIAFFGNGAILEIVDFSNPNGTVLLSSVPVPGPIQGVSVAGGLACVANGQNGLRVIDVSDPAQAFQSGVYPSPGCVEEVALINTHAYLAAGEAGLRVVDISDSVAPFEVGFLDTPGYADDIFVSGGLAYLADGDNLRIIDVSNAADPVEIGLHPTSSEYEKIVGLDVAGDHAYLVTQRTLGGGLRGLRIIDVSVPTLPVEAGFLDTFNEAYDVFVSGDHAFVAAGTSGLRVIDVSDPTAPAEVGFVSPPERFYGVEVSDNRAYVASWWDGLVIIDVAQPTAPLRVNKYDTRGQANVVAAAGDFALLNLFGENLFLLDVSDPDTPSIGGVFFPTTPASSIVLKGSCAYVTAGYPDLRIFDLSNPSAPVELSNLHIMGSWFAMDISVSGDFAYLPVLGGHGATGMQIVDISEPAAPFVVSYVQTAAPGCVTAGGGFAYLGDWYEMWVIDATAPYNPLVAARLDTPGKVEDLVLKDDHVFMVCSDSGLRIANVSDPYAPYDVGFFDTPGEASGVFVWDHYAYVADGTAGLRVIDITDLTAPVEAGYYDTGDWATSVYLDSGRIYVADRNDGLYILQNDLLSGAPDHELPTVARLSGVYPNPFNPQMSVVFSLAQPQPVNLVVFDLAGNQVAVIADRMFGSGTHTVPWDGRDVSGRAVASGTYVVRMDTPGQRESQKVTLLR